MAGSVAGAMPSDQPSLTLAVQTQDGFRAAAADDDSDDGALPDDDDGAGEDEEEEEEEEEEDVCTCPAP
jgi:ribosomal protein L12E/L44/L45/RPP1/RPP2